MSYIRPVHVTQPSVHGPGHQGTRPTQPTCVPRLQPGAGSSREGCGHQKEGVSQAVVPGTVREYGTLGFIEQVSLDTEETLAVEKAGGEGNGISRSPSLQRSLREQGPLGKRRRAI